MRFANITKGLVIAASTAFIMACGGGSPADKLMSNQEKVLSIIEDNKSDLDKAAKEVGEYINSHKDEMKAAMAEMVKMEDELKADPDKAAKMMAEFGERKMKLEARMAQLEKDVPNIKEHAGLKAAMSGMQD